MLSTAVHDRKNTNAARDENALATLICPPSFSQQKIIWRVAYRCKTFSHSVSVSQKKAFLQSSTHLDIYTARAMVAIKLHAVVYPQAFVSKMIRCTSSYSVHDRTQQVVVDLTYLDIDTMRVAVRPKLQAQVLQAISQAFESAVRSQIVTYIISRRRSEGILQEKAEKQVCVRLCVHGTVCGIGVI